MAAGQNATLVTGNNRVTHVGGDRIESTVKNAQSLVHGDAVSAVRGVSVRETARDDIHVVRGDMSAVVHGRHALHVAAKDGTKSASTTYVDGAIIQTATERIVLRAEKHDDSADLATLRLECGDTYVELMKDSVKISAKNVEIEAEESFTVTTKKAKIDGSESVELSRGAAVTGLGASGFCVKGVDKAELKTDGSRVLLNKGAAEMTGSDTLTMLSNAIKMKGGNTTDSSSTSSSSSDEVPGTKQLNVAFVHPLADKEDEPIKDTRYRLVAGEIVKEGKTSGTGGITASVLEETKQVQIILFVDELTEFADRYDAPLMFDLQVEDNLHAASDLQGARIRLRNLGYAPGTDLDVTDAKQDPLTARALQEFQRDQKIRASGKLDEDDTSGALDKAYGSAS